MRKTHSKSPLSIVLAAGNSGNSDEELASRLDVSPERVSRCRAAARNNGAVAFAWDPLVRDVVEAANNAYALMDGEGIIRFAGVRLRLLLDHKLEQLVGQPLSAIVLHEDKAHAEQLHDPGATKRPERLRLVRADSQEVECAVGLVDMTSHPLVSGFVVNFNPLPMAASANTAVPESLSQTAFRANPDAIAIVRLADMRIIDINDGWENITGYGRPDTLGKRLHDTRLFRDASEIDRILGNIEHTGEILDRELTLHNAQGYEISVLFSAEITDVDNERHVLCAFRDITDQKQAEEVVARTAERLREEQQELAEKNLALNHILQHLDREKADYRTEIASGVNNLLRPVLARVKSQHPAHADQAARIESALSMILSGENDRYQQNVTRLSRRQWEICQLIKTGKTSKEIAAALGITVPTVNRHRQLIREKLEIAGEGVNLSTYLRSR